MMSACPACCAVSATMCTSRHQQAGPPAPGSNRGLRGTVVDAEVGHARHHLLRPAGNFHVGGEQLGGDLRRAPSGSWPRGERRGLVHPTDGARDHRGRSRSTAAPSGSRTHSRQGRAHWRIARRRACWSVRPVTVWRNSSRCLAKAARRSVARVWASWSCCHSFRGCAGKPGSAGRGRGCRHTVAGRHRRESASSTLRDPRR